MQLPTRAPERRAITASAAKITGGGSSAYAKRLAQPWQDRALWAYDNCGEIRFSSGFYARLLSRVRYFPATLADDGTKTAITSGLPVETLNRIQDPGGGRSRLQRDYGRLMFVTGEGFLFVSEQEGRERWRFVWRDELFFPVDGTGTAERRDATGKLTGEKGTAYRFWTPHPRNSDLPDAPLQAVLDIVEELIILTQSVRGTATSRLTNGILAIAQELSPPPLDPGTDEDPNASPFLADYIEHVQAQIENPGSAAAKVPFLLEGSFDYIREGIQWVKTHDPATDYMERDLRVEAIHRLALSLDYPPEVLEGLTTANHWSGAIVQEEVWRSHGVGQAEQFADDLAAAFLRPALRDAEFSDWERVVVDYDDSQVVVSADRGTDADNAADRGMISDVGYRFMKGIPEDMAPSDEEKELWAAIKARDIPAIDAALGIVNKAGPTATPEAGNTDQPGTPAKPTQGRSGTRQEARVASIVGAAEFALRQCRAKAGARLRSYQGCDECKDKTDGLPNSLVASALGAAQLKELGAPKASELVKGGADELRGILSERWGIRDEDAQVLCSRVEFYAAKSLLQPDHPELPPGFVAQVEACLEVSDVPVEAAA